MYLGDRWKSQDLASSTYIWLPLTISGTSVTMKNKVNWVPNTRRGRWTENIRENSYEGEAGSAVGRARTVSCSDCSGRSSMGYIGGPDGGAVTISNVSTTTAGETTVRIKYVNGANTTRFANVRVNEQRAVKLEFLPTAGVTNSATFVANLANTGNVIVFEGVDGGWGPDIDRILVPIE
jgi:hypothetical protein